MPTTVWAPDPLPELEGRTGFVQVDDDLAEQLLAADQVQRPAVGAFALRNPGAAAGAESADAGGTYGTRDMTAERAPRRKRDAKASE